MSQYLPAAVYHPGAYDPRHAYGPGALVTDGGLYVCTAPVAKPHLYAEDTFQRDDVANGFGVASDGHSRWSDNNHTTILGGLSVVDGVGLITYDSSGALVGTSTNTWSLFGHNVPVQNVDFLLKWSYDLDNSTNLIHSLILHSDDDWDFYGPEIDTRQTQQNGYVFGNGDADGASFTPTLPADFLPGTTYWTRVRAQPSWFGTRSWPDGQPEPTGWLGYTIDAGTTEGVPFGRAIMAWWGETVNNQVIHIYYAAVQDAPLRPATDPEHWAPVGAPALAVVDVAGADAVLASAGVFVTNSSGTSQNVTLPPAREYAGQQVTIARLPAGNSWATVLVQPGEDDTYLFSEGTIHMSDGTRWCGIDQ